MFTIVTVIICVALGIFLMVLARHQEEGSDPQSAFYVFSVISYAVAGIWLISMTVGSYTYQLSDFAFIKQKTMQINLDIERRDNLVNTLKIELSKYPEIEKEIIENIKPYAMVLSQFPTLKSNETITSMVSQIMELENSVYKKRSGLIDLQNAIYYREEISPWVIWATPYKKFFNEDNPVQGLKIK